MAKPRLGMAESLSSIGRTTTQVAGTDTAGRRDWRVLVTGAAGLLGSWVSRTLAADGASVVGLDVAWEGETAVSPVPELRVIHGDVRNMDLVRRALGDHHVNLVIHLAAQPLVEQANLDPLPTFRSNIEGTWALLEACRLSSGIKGIVVASSDKAYGDSGGAVYTESMPLNATHPYSASKACADILAQTYAESFALPLAITRCGNLYGGGDLHWSRIIPGTVRSIVRGERPVIRSDGTYVRDYLYVEDAVRGVLGLAEAVTKDPELCGEAFNLSAATRLSVSEVVELIQKLMDSDLSADVRNEAVNEIPEQRVSPEKAERILGWKPRFSIEEGLARTISWYRSFLTGPSLEAARLSTIRDPYRADG